MSVERSRARPVRVARETRRAGTEDRRRLLVAIGATIAHATGRVVLAQDEVSDADLERESEGRVVRIGSPQTGSVATLPLEVYVARVLAAEADPRSPDAAKEALAVAIRTYALVNEGRHAREGYGLCDTTHCQVVRPSTPTTRRLARVTALRLLTYDGRPAALYYSASCGGVSERASDVWPGADYPYLQVRPDNVHTEETPWTLALSLGDADAVLRRLGCAGTLTDLQIATRTSSGRVGALRPTGMEPALVGGNDFRLAVGGTRVRSTAFSLARERDTLVFTGRGYGHGVGMCAVGAGARAMRGESSRMILEHYYPGLELVRLGQGTAGPGPAGRVGPRPQPFPR